ncbi:MAG: SurA N-terminal domain-containing protein [Thioalkalivibrionaceae bacterium]
MLQAIRDKATGWVAYIFVGIIAVPFAVWGLGEYFGGAGPLIAAEVGDSEITVRAVQDEARSQRDQLRAMMGGELPADFDDAAARERALDALIDRALLDQAVSRLGLRVGDAAVFREIASIGAFQEEGRFSASRYQQVLEAQRIGATDFERDVARSLQLAQLEQALSGTTWMAPQSVRQLDEWSQQQRRVRLQGFSARPEAVAEAITDREIEAAYAERAESLREPARLRVAYLMLDPAVLDDTLEVSDADVREHYELSRARFTEPEYRAVRQILVADALHDDAQARARELRSRIDGGEDFAEVAREYSDDEVSARRGGQLGEVARGELSDRLDTVVFSLPVGLVSQPIRVERGFAIVEVTEVTPASVQPFEQVRDEVAADLRDRRAEQRQIELLDALIAQTFEHPDSLEPAAAATGLEIRESDWFALDSGTGIASHRGVRQAAFSPAVREDGRNSDVIDLPDGRTVVLRVADEQPSRVPPLETVRERLVANLVQENLARLTAEEAAADRDALLALDESERAERFADRSRWTEVGELRRDGDWPFEASHEALSGISIDARAVDHLRNAVLRMPAPVDDVPTFEIVTLDDGASVLVALEAVVSSADGVGTEGFSLLSERDRFARSLATVEIEAWLAALRASTDIRRYPENLE